jgi:hypothetical protein
MIAPRIGDRKSLNEFGKNRIEPQQRHVCGGAIPRSGRPEEFGAACGYITGQKTSSWMVVLIPVRFEMCCSDPLNPPRKADVG